MAEEKKLSDKTLKALLDRIKSEREQLPTDWDSEILQSGRNEGLLRDLPTPKRAITAFQDMAWDLPSFVEWIRELDIPGEDAKDLMGEAVFRKDEWDT